MMNRHPVILKQLGELLPPGARRPDTRLVRDLRIAGPEQLVPAIEEAWSIQLAPSRVAAWVTLADVCNDIADTLEAQAAA